jgi:hypothetical protein
MLPENHAATAENTGESRSASASGVSLRGIEILARSIYRELCDRGCPRSDVIRLATALLDQLVAGKVEPSVVEQLASGRRRSAR